jgi:hypothetical protein
MLYFSGSLKGCWSSTCAKLHSHLVISEACKALVWGYHLSCVQDMEIQIIPLIQNVHSFLTQLTGYTTKSVASHVKMRGNIACHMWCHLAFSKCVVTSHVTFNVTSHFQNMIELLGLKIQLHFENARWHVMLPPIFKMWSNIFCSDMCFLLESNTTIAVSIYWHVEQTLHIQRKIRKNRTGALMLVLAMLKPIKYMYLFLFFF